MALSENSFIVLYNIQTIRLRLWFGQRFWFEDLSRQRCTVLLIMTMESKISQFPTLICACCACPASFMAMQESQDFCPYPDHKWDAFHQFPALPQGIMYCSITPHSFVYFASFVFIHFLQCFAGNWYMTHISAELHASCTCNSAWLQEHYRKDAVASMPPMFKKQATAKVHGIKKK